MYSASPIPGMGLTNDNVIDLTPMKIHKDGTSRRRVLTEAQREAKRIYDRNRYARMTPEHRASRRQK